MTSVAHDCAADSSDDDFMPPPASERVAAALHSLSPDGGGDGAVTAPSSPQSLRGTWVLQMTPPPLGTTRMVLALDERCAGGEFWGTGRVTVARDTHRAFAVEVKGAVLCCPVVRFVLSLCPESETPLLSAVAPWEGTYTVLIDDTACYFSGTYAGSDHTSGVVTGALTSTGHHDVFDTTKMGSHSAGKPNAWPPSPPEDLQRRQEALRKQAAAAAPAEAPVSLVPRPPPTPTPAPREDEASAAGSTEPEGTEDAAPEPPGPGVEQAEEIVVEPPVAPQPASAEPEPEEARRASGELEVENIVREPPGGSEEAGGEAALSGAAQSAEESCE